VDAEHLPALFVAGSEDSFEDPLLLGKAGIELGASIQADLTDKPCLR